MKKTKGIRQTTRTLPSYELAGDRAVVLVPTDMWDAYVFDCGVIVRVRGNKATVDTMHGQNPEYYALMVAKILRRGLQWRGGFWASEGAISDKEAQR